ncbi:exonuclease 3'-5' domain-containing protein 2 isoform X1 [Gambusia affinis]|uniref:exonuclease 3'-5' domain-containing protein 2 isoform X1 n=1 Tax=Gambusia affinis TaxID=33528 RepID=UPI001CDC1298|nr:exonuclease 3'-5' domain-containing protein 2 isoform X1 [Gambusia affinis]
MSPRGPLTTVITTIVGAALGGLLVWQVYRTKRKKPSSVQQAVEPTVSLHPVENAPARTESRQTQLPRLAHDEFKTVECQTESAPPAVWIPTCEQLLAVRPVTVSSEEDWLEMWPLMQKELSVFPVLGLDCEWVKAQSVSMKGRSSAVSLLQMATYSGLCVLVRLLTFRGGQQPFPLSFVEVLRDPYVLKVGVGCYDDGKRLTRDYGLSLATAVDLRHLALRERRSSVSNGLSLKSLAADLLNVPLDKSLELRCSDWEADQLTPEQTTYAARDAQISVALFLRLLGLQTETGPALSSGSSYSELVSRCQGLVDVPFRGRGDGDDGAPERERRRRTRKPVANDSPESGDQQVPDPRKNNRRKPLGVGYSARKSPLYDNCFLYAPDGQPLCTCDKKKALWYLDKGIGELQSDDPFIVRLLFEPSGRPDSQQDYYLTAKENLCVVCGKADSYIRKNVVPHEYRRHFPTEMKDHNSHDILLLCTGCHAASNVHDGSLKQQLAAEFAAPQGCEEEALGARAPALLSAKDGLPEQRRDELQLLIRNYMDMEEEQELTNEELQEAAALETRILNEAYVPHGLKVVRAHAQRGLRGLMELERRWRRHFLTTMRPRHLPPLWSVDHNHSKFLRKFGEDLPIKLN